jgi:beta-N-acetylhexosaminidase
MEKPVLAAVLSLSAPRLTDEEKRFLETSNPFGIALFKRNLTDPEQTKALICSIFETVGHNRIFIALDQEGGRVNRLKEIGFPEYAFQRTLGKLDSSDITRTHALLIARDMLAVGANLNFAPVLDLEYPDTTEALKGRSFGTSADSVILHGRILIDTYFSNGICPCMKHLPGHGRAKTDPHLGLPVINADLSKMSADLAPFRALNDCPTAMTAHILLPHLDPENPITLSSNGISFIRKETGFKNILISDALEMKALKGSIAEKAAAALDAGCDIVCYCGGQIAENLSICDLKRYVSDDVSPQIEHIFQHLSSKKKIINLDREEKRYYSLVSQFRDDDIHYDATETLHQMFKGE